MERIAIAIQDGGAGAGASMAARAARPTSFLSCHRTSMWGPPPVWDFLVSNFHPCWRKIYLLKLEAAVRAAKEAATTASTSRFVPVTLPAGKAS